MMDTRRTWIFFPDFTAASPYQTHLAHGLARCGWDVRPGGVPEALAAQRAGPAVLHIGWEQPVYAGALTEFDAISRVDAALDAIDGFRTLGGTVVWTIHNRVPHEERYPAVNAQMQRGLAQRTDLAHAHNRAGAAHAAAMGVDPGAIVVYRHPCYDGVYPDDITDDAARRYLSLEPEAFVFVFFGAMRGYKGLSRLRRVFDDLADGLPWARLIIAGRSAQPDPARLRAPDPRLRILSREIMDAEVQYLMRAADVVVLPYEAILTSGPMTLARTFGRPVMVPDHPSLAEEVTDGVDGLLYGAGSDATLAMALVRAASAVADVRGPMRGAARAAIADRTFVGLAQLLSSSVHAGGSVRSAA